MRTGKEGPDRYGFRRGRHVRDGDGLHGGGRGQSRGRAVGTADGGGRVRPVIPAFRQDDGRAGGHTLQLGVQPLDLCPCPLLAGGFHAALLEIGARVAFQRGLADGPSVQRPAPDAPGIPDVVPDFHGLPVELRQLRRVVAAGIELQPAVAGDAARARHEQLGLHALRHAHRCEAPRREGLPVFLRAVVAQAALRVPVAGKSPVRRGVVFLHTGQDVALELFPARQHGPLARLEGGPRELEIAVGRVPVHERAGIAGQPLRRPYPERLDRSFHKALALRAARYGISGRDPQTGHHARAVVQQQTVDVARPAIAVEQGRDAAVTTGHAQGVQHGQGAFGQGYGDAHAAARGHVQDGRDFRLEGLAVVRVQHLRVKSGAVRRINIGGPQLRGVAALVGAQLQQGIARCPSGFALRLAHLGQQAAAGMDAGRQFAALAHGPAQLGVGQCHGGVLRFLVMEKKFGGPRGGLGCRALGRKGRLAASQIIGIPAIKRARGQAVTTSAGKGHGQQFREDGRQLAHPGRRDQVRHGGLFAYQRRDAVQLAAEGQTGRHDGTFPVGEGRTVPGGANRGANIAANRSASRAFLCDGSRLAQQR